MCIAIFKPASKVISKDYLRNAFENNSDGAGFLVHDPKANELLCYKGFFKFRDFWNKYSQFSRMKCIIHFRIRTSGKRDEPNCHPFMVNANLGFIHNGVISINRPKECFSDTWHFNQRIRHFLEKVPFAWEKDSLRRFFDKIGSKEYSSIGLGGSKFIFMDSNGKHAIFNEKAGTWEDGVWYSNTSYKSKGRSCEIKASNAPSPISLTSAEIAARYDKDNGVEWDDHSWHGKHKKKEWRDSVFDRAVKHQPNIKKKKAAFASSKATPEDIVASNHLALQDLAGMGTKFLRTSELSASNVTLPASDTIECVKCSAVVPKKTSLSMGDGFSICKKCSPVRVNH